MRLLLICWIYLSFRIKIVHSLNTSAFLWQIRSEEYAFDTIVSWQSNLEIQLSNQRHTSVVVVPTWGTKIDSEVIDVISELQRRAEPIILISSSNLKSRWKHLLGVFGRANIFILRNNKTNFESEKCFHHVKNSIFSCVLSEVRTIRTHFKTTKFCQCDEQLKKIKNRTVNILASIYEPFVSYDNDSNTFHGFEIVLLETFAKKRNLLMKFLLSNKRINDISDTSSLRNSYLLKIERE